ncbi:oxidoreductase [Hymenopellis radicata]|nr:oxidoreductase [Hymenopellis radicata]
MSKRANFKILTAEDVARHHSREHCWLSYRGKVYNVSGFLGDHPGGEDIILRYGGRAVDRAMGDSNEHEHSDAAYDMLEEFVIGKLGTEETVVSQDWVATDGYWYPDDTDVAADFAKNKFLDLNRPLVMQVWRANFSKSFYLKQIHQPRHLPRSAVLFGPAYLEIFTKAAWYVPPTLWLPMAGYLFLRSLFQFMGPIPLAMDKLSLPLSSMATIPLEAYGKVVSCFLLGNFLWTILEYLLHRFFFHLDEYLPDHNVALTLHFLLHGFHHYLPMDRLRLVMPPILFAILQFPITQLIYKLFPVAVANGIIAGAFTFYVLYDCMHYAVHHTNLPAYLKEIKKYHLGHHYKNYELGFGVTSKIWDIVFDTVLPV